MNPAIPSTRVSALQAPAGLASIDLRSPLALSGEVLLAQLASIIAALPTSDPGEPGKVYIDADGFIRVSMPEEGPLLLSFGGSDPVFGSSTVRFA